MAKIDAQTTTVVMPTQQQIDKERSEKENPAAKAFAKDAFSYDAASDTYTCPDRNWFFNFIRPVPMVFAKRTTARKTGVYAKTAHILAYARQKNAKDERSYEMNLNISVSN